MGYRLNVLGIGREFEFYGTKLYGYVDLEQLNSWRWLVSKGFIEEDDNYFGYGAEHNIVMSIADFREFAKLYNDDLNNFICDNCIQNNDSFINLPAIKELLLLDDFDKVLVCWC